MPSFFNNVTGKNSATLFEIRLDNDIVVLRGTEDEASSQLLKGVVVLCLPSALKVEDVHLRMTGRLKIGWNDQRITASGVTNNKSERTSEIFNHKWAPFVGGSGPGSSSKGVVLHAGNYEWPFELVVPGGVAESIEGLSESYIVYKLKATVARGKLAYDLHARKAVRIVRTLDPSALELAHAMTVENIWPNKVEYQLVIPQKAIIFGTAVDIEMKFTSLLKGLRIGPIRCELVELQEFTIPAASPAYPDRLWKHQRNIEAWTFQLAEDDYHDMLNDEGQDGYITKQRLPLPKSLSRCLQDVDVHGIKIRHKVKFNVSLLNPDGHVSELRATLPVTIFISPNMPMTEDGYLLDQTPMSTQSSDIAHHAPPLYGQHILDQLYADVDMSGIMTPAPQSGMNTPFYSQSRAGSSENLASLDGAASHLVNGAVAPAALTSRLHNLNAGSRNSSFHRLSAANSGANTPYTHAHHDSEGSNYFDQQHSSGPNSNPLSRHSSNEDGYHSTSALTSGHHTPEHLDVAALGDLSKVPSYRTAVKTPARGLNNDGGLPNYDTAISAPPSPNRSYSTLATPEIAVQEVPSPSRVPEDRGGEVRRMGFTPIHPPMHPQVGHGEGDDTRRLSILRDRGRAH